MKISSQLGSYPPAVVCVLHCNRQRSTFSSSSSYSPVLVDSILSKFFLECCDSTLHSKRSTSQISETWHSLLWRCIQQAIQIWTVNDDVDDNSGINNVKLLTTFCLVDLYGHFRLVVFPTVWHSSKLLPDSLLSACSVLVDVAVFVVVVVIVVFIITSLKTPRSNSWSMCVVISG